ncbi:hypothetical protein LIER_05129 [Lithospermum erythrorhizon]|uniref:Protein Iojap-related, mitochondrial n=1 Tax=Lithospermum erythrorhizon TaxID=34254 RepID=A0AAV3NZC6_LITER
MWSALRSRGVSASFQRCCSSSSSIPTQLNHSVCSAAIQDLQNVDSSNNPTNKFDFKTLLSLEEVKKILDDVRADNVQVIPVPKHLDFADYMVVASGRSTWHVRNIAQALIYKVKQKQEGEKRKLLPSVEGQQGGNWIVIDSGSLIIHALEENVRSYYNLENVFKRTSSPEEQEQDLDKAFVKIRPKNNSKKKPPQKKE